MSFLRNDLMIFFFPASPKIPVGAQSTPLLFPYYCSLLNTVCSLCSTGDERDHFWLGFFFFLPKELSGDKETSAMLLPLTGSLCFHSWLF